MYSSKADGNLNGLMLLYNAKADGNLNGLMLLYVSEHTTTIAQIAVGFSQLKK